MPKPVVVLSSSRSGTNYLLAVFARMRPDAVVLREVFRKGSDSLPELSALTGLNADALVALAARDPVTLWETVMTAARGQPLALKVFYYHQPVGAPLWHRIAGEAQVVHLIRRRLLDTFISLKLAEATGEWMRMGDGPATEAPLLQLDPGEVQAFIALRQDYAARARSQFADVDFHEIAFEDIAGDPVQCARVLSPIIGVDVPADLQIPVRRQNSRPPSETVANYAEIAEYDCDHL